MDVLRSENVKIRKPRSCFGCGKRFDVGSTLSCTTCVDGGEIMSTYMCLECVDYINEHDEIRDCDGTVYEYCVTEHKEEYGDYQ